MKSLPDHINTFADLRGASRIAIDAVAGVTDIVEAMHRNIAGLAPVVGREPAGSARGISGMVYSGVRGVTRVVGFGLDAVLGQLTPLLRHRGKSAQREAVQAALNGVLGDYLAATANPLAIPMQLRSNGRALVLERAALKKEFSAGATAAPTKLVVLAHGL